MILKKQMQFQVQAPDIFSILTLNSQKIDDCLKKKTSILFAMTIIFNQQLPINSGINSRKLMPAKYASRELILARKIGSR